MCERFGTGLKRIHDVCVEADVKYEFKRQKLGFSVAFYRPQDLNLDPVTGQVVEKFTERFTERFTVGEQAVLSLILDNPFIT